MQIDRSTEFGARVERRLLGEIVIWLTTVRADGTPEPSPVWFLWDGSTFLIYSQPDKPKLKHIARDPHVSLNFDSNGKSDDIVIFTGEARIDNSALPANAIPDYVGKYQEDIKRIGMTLETFARGYSVAIRVTPTRVRGH